MGRMKAAHQIITESMYGAHEPPALDLVERVRARDGDWAAAMDDALDDLVVDMKPTEGYGGAVILTASSAPAVD